MARSRDAVDTIKGYYYQFDYFIFQLISLVNEEDTVTIEGIEDVDILEEKEMVAVQCKYYAKTEYNHSVIAKPIRLDVLSITVSLISRILFEFGYYYKRMRAENSTGERGMAFIRCRSNKKSMEEIRARNNIY